MITREDALLIMQNELIRVIDKKITTSLTNGYRKFEVTISEAWDDVILGQVLNDYRTAGWTVVIADTSGQVIFYLNDKDVAKDQVAAGPGDPEVQP